MASGDIANIRKVLQRVQAKVELLSKMKLNLAFKFKASFDIKDIKRFEKVFKKSPALFKRGVDYAMKSIAPEIKQALDDAMDAPIWKWKEGDTRDIVDTGALKKSGRVFYREGTIGIRYGEEYAMIVHYGGYVGSGYQPDLRIYYPARPWVQAVLEGNVSGVTQYPLVERFREYFFDYIRAKQPSLIA